MTSSQRKPSHASSLDRIASRLGGAGKLLVNFLELDRRIAELHDRHLQIVNRMRQPVERFPNLRHHLAELVPTLLARRLRAQYPHRRLQLVDTTIQLRL